MAQRQSVKGRGSQAIAGGGARQRIRIIGGLWKRTPIPVPDVPGLRPTPDRVRETLFNWLGQSLAGQAVLDPFAGSGALGLEAASRGAGRVVLIESDDRAQAALRRLCGRLGASQVELIPADALRWLSEAAVREAGRFDLVLLDPPFGLGLIERVLPDVQRLLAPAGRVYVESERAWQDEALPGWSIVRAARAGQVHYHLLARTALALARHDKEPGPDDR